MENDNISDEIKKMLKKDEDEDVDIKEETKNSTKNAESSSKKTSVPPDSKKLSPKPTDWYVEKDEHGRFKPGNKNVWSSDKQPEGRGRPLGSLNKSKKITDELKEMLDANNGAKRKDIAAYMVKNCKKSDKLLAMVMDRVEGPVKQELITEHKINTTPAQMTEAELNEEIARLQELQSNKLLEHKPNIIDIKIEKIDNFAEKEENLAEEEKDIDPTA